MTILCSKYLEHSLDYYFSLPKDTYIYIPKLATNGGTRLIKEAMQEGVKLYKGDARRKTTKERWLQHVTTGAKTPNTTFIQLSNGVRIYDYSRFDPIDESQLTPEEMQPLAELLVAQFKAPKTPSSIIKAEIPYTSVIQNTNAYGSQRSDHQWDEIEMLNANHSMMGGAIYNMHRNGAYQLVDYETHVDFHQMYAFICMNFDFPHLGFGYETFPGYVPHPLAVYNIVGGWIRLKKNGFPLLNTEKISKTVAREDVMSDWTPVPWKFLTNPDLEVLLENYEVHPKHPLQIAETFRYKRSIPGLVLFGNFVHKMYAARSNAEGSVKRFYKLLNEYLPGTFERKGTMSHYWKDLDGPDPKQKRKYIRYNCLIGSFITAYGRRLMSALLQQFPYDKVLGWDTDCVFFHGKPEEVPQQILDRFGDAPGQLHFDGIYHGVRHLAPKQYYGYNEDGQVFAKISSVPNGVEYAKRLIESGDRLWDCSLTQSYSIWDRAIKEYTSVTVPIKICVDKYRNNNGDEEWLRKNNLIHGLL